MVSHHSMLTLLQKPQVVGDKLESVMARLDRLRGATWNELQHKQWAMLFE